MADFSTINAKVQSPVPVLHHINPVMTTYYASFVKTKLGAIKTRMMILGKISVVNQLS